MELKHQLTPHLKHLRLSGILETLDAAGGNKKLAEQMLGIDRSTLYARLKEYGL